jgi:hypothetical protein
MSVVGKLVALLATDNSAWKRGFDDAGKDMDKFNGKSKGFFKDLKSQFGKSSTLGQSLKLIAGGGAIGALSMLGKELANATDEIVKMSQAFRKGEIESGMFFEKVAAGVPVLGGFWQFGRNIRESFTHEREEADKFKASLDAHLKVLTDYTNQIKEIGKASNASHDKLQGMYDNEYNKGILARAPDNTTKDVWQSLIDQNKKINDAKKELDEAVIRTMQARQEAGKGFKYSTEWDAAQTVLKAAEAAEALRRGEFEAVKNEIVKNGEKERTKIIDDAARERQKQLQEEADHQQEKLDQYNREQKDKLKSLYDSLNADKQQLIEAKSTETRIVRAGDTRQILRAPDVMQPLEKLGEKQLEALQGISDILSEQVTNVQDAVTDILVQF